MIRWCDQLKQLTNTKIQASIKFIGKVHSDLKKLEDCPLQENEDAPEASILIHTDYIEGIRDLHRGSEILVLTWLDKADRTVIKCRPRREKTGPAIGVFSTRSPDRPNPIGLHTVKVLSVSAEGEIIVSGLEVLDQTPVLDIKPVIGR